MESIRARIDLLQGLIADQESQRRNLIAKERRLQGKLLVARHRYLSAMKQRLHIDAANDAARRSLELGELTQQRSRCETEIISLKLLDLEKLSAEKQKAKERRTLSLLVNLKNLQRFKAQLQSLRRRQKATPSREKTILGDSLSRVQARISGPQAQEDAQHSIKECQLEIEKLDAALKTSEESLHCMAESQQLRLREVENLKHQIAECQTAFEQRRAEKVLIIEQLKRQVSEMENRPALLDNPFQHFAYNPSADLQYHQQINYPSNAASDRHRIDTHKRPSSSINPPSPVVVTPDSYKEAEAEAEAEEEAEAEKAEEAAEVQAEVEVEELTPLENPFDLLSPSELYQKQRNGAVNRVKVATPVIRKRKRQKKIPVTPSIHN